MRKQNNSELKAVSRVSECGGKLKNKKAITSKESLSARKWCSKSRKGFHAFGG